MKKACMVSLAVATGAALFTASPLCAAAAAGPKARLFAKYDSNRNGIIDGTEIDVVRKAFAANPQGEFARYDADKDGRLSDEEIARIKPPGAKKGGGKKEGGRRDGAGTPKPAS